MLLNDWVGGADSESGSIGGATRDELSGQTGPAALLKIGLASRLNCTRGQSVFFSWSIRAEFKISFSTTKSLKGIAN